jgi:hypothetical protein
VAHDRTPGDGGVCDPRHGARPAEVQESENKSRGAAAIARRLREKKRGLSLEARGLWDVIADLQQLESRRDDGSQGWTLEQLTRFAGTCSSGKVTHLLGQLMTADIVAQSDGLYHVPQIRCIQDLRQAARQRTQRWRQNGGASRDAVRASRDAQIDSVPAPPLSPSHTLPLTHTPPLPIPSGSGHGVAALADGGTVPPKTGGPMGRKRRPAGRERVLSDEQVATWKWFQDWWIGNWPRFHGGVDVEYLGNRDAPAALRFLKRQMIDWDRSRAEQIALFFLALPEIYGLADHPLTTLAARGNYYARKCDEWQKTGMATGLKLAGQATPAAAAAERSSDRVDRLLAERLERKEKIG